MKFIEELFQAELRLRRAAMTHASAESLRQDSETASNARKELRIAARNYAAVASRFEKGRS